MKFALCAAETIVFWLLIPLTIISTGSPLSLPIAFLGWVVVAFGVFLAFYSSLIMLFDGGGAPYYFYAPKKLVISGPYRFLRHPLYLAYLLFLAGLLISNWSLVGLYLLFGIGLLIVFYVFIFEERKLMENFEKFREYAKFLVQIIVWPKVVNSKALKSKGPHVIAILHQTHYDGPLAYYAVNRYFRFVSTALYFDRIPFMWKVGIIPVKRYTVDFLAMKRIIETIRNGFDIGIAPEAARTWDGEPICIRKEIWKLLRKLNIPVIPVKFYGIQRLWPRWSNRIRLGRATIEFGDPVSPEDQHSLEMSKMRHYRFYTECKTRILLR